MAIALPYKHHSTSENKLKFFLRQLLYRQEIGLPGYEMNPYPQAVWE